ncbi:hypothetical protein BD309DRAFT_987966 [Dichomitus squalens]|uniref:Uncharacterized protein n=1 Tax=Dichomitus squalens TaxID=114155 RepID=A0A4Q9P271_9APHY|nr:hypothetical protein BD309DRAFT_987966 [Dichomitus squalens]TBU57730.1 hypothetical protein BD310DRAFT_949189 [Dichomitus squalens]
MSRGTVIETCPSAFVHREGLLASMKELVQRCVLFLYDALITTGDEIQCFWGKKLTGAAILFWLNKYITTFFMVWSITSYFKISDVVCTHSIPRSCVASGKGLAAIDYLLLLVLPAFTGIRVYALRKSLLLASAAAILSTVPLGVNFVDFAFGLTGEIIFPFGCVLLIIIETIMARSCLIAADCIAIGVTWYTLSRRRDIRQPPAFKGTISDVLLVDAYHFSCSVFSRILAVLNTLHLTFTVVSLDVNFLQSTSNVTQFTVPLSAILISRFLLHLQGANLRAIGGGSSHAFATTHNTSIIFNRVAGSIGAPIDADDYFSQDRGTTENEGKETKDGRRGRCA